MKKYELTDEIKEINGITLYRIKALIDFGDVKTGYLGGWIAKEENLSQEGQCWVSNNACVFGNAKVYNDACVHGDARVFGDACIFDNAHVFGSACVSGNAHVSGYACISGNVRVRDNAKVFGDAYISDYARIYGNAKVFGNAWIHNDAHVYGDAKVFDHAHVCGNACVYDNACVYGNTYVHGDAIICERMFVSYSRIDTDLRTDMAASLRGQCNLLLIRNKVIAYKIVNRNLTSLYDKNFIYKIGEIAEVENPDESNESCASGLHFSSLTYWDHNVQGYKNKVYLVVEIDIEDIITIQQGKIRCKKAKILDKIDIK